MNSELYNLIIGKKDKQYTINYLIKKNIISVEEVTFEVIKTNDPKIIYYAAKNIEGIISNFKIIFINYIFTKIQYFFIRNYARYLSY